MARLLTIALTAALLALLFASSAPAQQAHSTWRKEFDQAAKLGSKSKMDQLMKDGQDFGIYWIQTTAEQVDAAPSDILYERYDALRRSWERVYDTDFPDKMERFFSSLNPAAKRGRSSLKKRYTKAVKAQENAQKDKSKSKLNLVADDFEGIASAFKQYGDEWMEAQSQMNLAVALEEAWHGKKTNFNRMTNAYARFVKLREDLGVRDRSYREAVPRLKGLQGLGFGSAGAAGGTADGAEDGGAVIASGPETTGDAIEVKMEFELLNAIKDTQRPNYYLDEHRQIWPSINLGALGSTAKFARIEDSPTMIREGPNKAVIDLDGDGEGDLVWPTRGKFDTVSFEFGTGASKRKWAVLTEIGRQADYYQNAPMNLQLTDSSFLLYFIPAGSMVGEISGVKIQVIDDNIDGIYGSPPTKWHYMGLVEGSDQPDFDSIRIGGSKAAQPWSQYVKVGKAGWHRLESVDGGTQINAQPVAFKTGTLQLKVKGLKPDNFIVHGFGDELSQTYIDIAGGKKVEVPIGRWELSYGIVRKGNKMQAMKAVILSTDSMKVFDVSEGENVEIEIGAPYKFDFEYEVKGKKVVVDGTSIRVIGRAGESYDRFYGAVPRPVAGIRKMGGGKRPSATQKMKPVVANDGIQKHGWAAMWKPLPVELPRKGDQVEVQLIEKKNKLFGSIGSDWK